jgi:hypothetical protein
MLKEMLKMLEIGLDCSKIPLQKGSRAKYQSFSPLITIFPELASRHGWLILYK